MTAPVADLNDAQLFTKVVELHSFSAAARSLGLPVSSVSRKVARLEEQLGARLLHRTTRKLSLTDAGETYYRLASGALEQLGAAAQQVAGMHTEPRGRIRFTSVPAMGRLAWDLIASFLAQHPQVSIEMDLTERTVDLVEGGYDLALRAGQLGDSSLISKRLMDNRFSLFAAPGYLEARGVPATLEELRDHDCVIHGLSSRQATWGLVQGRNRRELRVSGRLAVTSLETVILACLDGMGIAMLPQRWSQRWVAEGRVVPVLPDWTGPTTGLWLVYPSRRQLSPTVRAFMDHLAHKIDDKLLGADVMHAWLGETDRD